MTSEPILAYVFIWALFSVKFSVVRNGSLNQRRSRRRRRFYYKTMSCIEFRNTLRLPATRRSVGMHGGRWVRFAPCVVLTTSDAQVLPGKASMNGTRCRSPAAMAYKNMRLSEISASQF